MHVRQTTTPTVRLGARLAAIALVPVLALSACKITDVPNAIVGLFGMGKNEVATPQFEVTNGIKVQVVIKAPEGQAGTPVVIHVRCAGGSHASTTVTLKDSGSVSLGQTTFQEGWPAGTDCLVSQEVVQGVEVAKATLTWVSSNLLKADFLNA